MRQDFTTPVSPDPATLQKLQSLNTIGTISYVMHLIVAIGAVIPGPDRRNWRSDSWRAVWSGVADCGLGPGYGQAQ
ncbi:MAG: hypothetical protein RL081_1853 [Pseudomonadota bacterium]